jgi:hypothetical protein
MARKRKTTLSVPDQKATGNKRRPRNHNAIINEAAGDATAATVTAHTSSPHSHIWNEDHGFKLVRQGCDDTFYYGVDKTHISSVPPNFSGYPTILG